MAMATDILIPFNDNAFGNYNNYDSSLSFDTIPASDPFIAQPDEEVTSDIQAEVSGACFVLNSRDFQKLACLPWQRLHASAFRLDGASPQAFEKCLDYILFDALPKRKRMTATEKEEVASLAQALNLVQLVEYMTSSKRGNSISRSSKTKGSSPSPKKKQNILVALFGCNRRQSCNVEETYGVEGARDSAKSFTTF